MNPKVKNVLAIVVGFLVGSFVNIAIVNLGHLIIPHPAGVDVSDMEGLKASMSLFSPQHFIAPFLAHALGTLVGALIASLIAASHNFKFAMAIGVIFLLGGITMVFIVGGPLWFILLDLFVAYIPMALLGWKFSGKGQQDDLL